MVRGGGGGGVNKQAPETETCRGFWENSLPENFEILKLGNATFSNFEEILKKKGGSEDPPPPHPSPQLPLAPLSPIK